MNYAVYIFDVSEKADFDDFAGNTNIATAIVDGAANAAASMVGFDFYEKYVKKLKHVRSCALTGSVVEDVKISTGTEARKNFQIGEQNWIDVSASDLKHTITVNGRLEEANTLFGMGNDIAKKKNAARIWQWANTPIDGYEEYGADYYRDVFVVISGADGRRYRAAFAHRVNVKSYEEHFDINGEGHFTLVMEMKILKEAPENEQDKNQENLIEGNSGVINIFLEDEDLKTSTVFVEGPDFKQNALSVANDIGKAVKTASDNLAVGTKVTQKIAGTEDKDLNDTLDKIDKINAAVKQGAQSFQNTAGTGNFSKDNLQDQIDKNVDSVNDAIKSFKTGTDKESSNKS